MNKLNILGVTITILYMIFVSCIVYPKFNIASLQTLPLNELGDFLAGVFGPLALAWLIIGYFQQQKELKLNTKALNIQAKELKETTKHQEEISKLTQQQFEYEIRRNIPKFIIVIGLEDNRGERHHIFDIKLTNGKAFGLRSYISSDKGQYLDSYKSLQMTAGDKFTLKIVDKPNTDDVCHATISVIYKNSDGIMTTEKFLVTEYRGHYIEDSELLSQPK